MTMVLIFERLAQGKVDGQCVAEAGKEDAPIAPPRIHPSIHPLAVAFGRETVTKEPCCRIRPAGAVLVGPISSSPGCPCLPVAPPLLTMRDSLP